TWTQLTPTGPGPSPREEHVGLYFVYPQPPGPNGFRAMLVYGGKTQSDAWLLSLDPPGSPGWSQAEILGNGAGFDGHAGLAAAVDNTSTVWMFGGVGMTPWKLIQSYSTGVDAAPHRDVQLLGALPNPSRGPLVIGFSLRDASSARLELFDLAGRRIESRELGSLGIGFHPITLRPSSPIPLSTSP